MGTYILTVQPSVSFWDCGELSATAAKMEVPHQPGAPLWTLISRFVMMIPYAADLGLRVNLAANLLSALAVMFLYLISVRLIVQWRGFPKTMVDAIVAYGSSAIGAMVLTFSDTFWFNAVESEVYAGSMFFVLIVVWLGCVWYDKSNAPGSEKYLLIAAYLVGLSIGVHQLSLMVYFTIGLLIYFRKYDYTFKSFLTASIIVALSFFIIYPGVVEWLPSLLDGDLRIGSTHIQDSVIVQFLPVFVVVGVIYGIYYSVKHKKRTLNIAFTSVLLILLGYSTYTLIIIRAAAKPAINMSNPDNMSRFVSYIGREQFGAQPPIMKRRWSDEPDKAARFKNYKSDLDYFWSYQLDHMYLRYFGFNFVGRSGDIQDARVEWFGDHSKESTASPKGFPSRYFAIPLLLGIIGAFYHFRKDWKPALAFMALFVTTGIALVVYFNMQNPQPRERDYFYVASFGVFALWVGFGVSAILEFFEENLKQSKALKPALGSILGLLVFIVPVNMAVQNWHTHDRSKNFVPWDLSYNTLQSCEKDAVLFTNGDNDTYPLWYLQEVEDIRTDVRVVNLSLLNTDWHILQLKNEQPHGSKKVNFTLSDAQILDIARQGGMLWEAKDVVLPVPRKALEEFGVTDTSVLRSEKITFRMPSTYPGEMKAIRTQDAMVKSLIEANKWERPIYFAVTVGTDGRIGLDEYLRMEGLAMRITPNRRNVGETEYVSREAMEAHLMNEIDGFYREPHKGFKFRGLNDSTIYFDENVHRLCGNFRQAFLSLAIHYLNVEKNNEKAVQVLDRMDEKLPRKLIHMDYRLMYSIANLYNRAGRRDLYLSMLDDVGRDCEAAIQRNPNDIGSSYWNPYNILLDVYKNKKDYTKEMNLWTRIATVYPNDPTIKQRMAELQSLINAQSIGNPKNQAMPTDSGRLEK
jgi:hypothetical protein